MMPIVKKYTIKTECDICFNKLSKVVNSMLMYKVNNLFLGKKLHSTASLCGVKAW